jgi:DNA-binding HxlR family transcriptional regulator
MTKKPGKPVRGSTTGRPLMVLLDAFGQRWTLRILWELRAEALTFRELQSRCEELSPTILNRRLKNLREMLLIEHSSQGYGLSEWGKKIGRQLAQLDTLASEWARALP